MSNAYEVRNPSFSDMTLEQQIEVGVNDWCAEGRSGHPYFGRTKKEAEAIRAQFEVDKLTIEIDRMENEAIRRSESARWV